MFKTGLVVCNIMYVFTDTFLLHTDDGLNSLVFVHIKHNNNNDSHCVNV